MSERESQITIFENEDLVFDLKSRQLLKASDRLWKRFGKKFSSLVKTLDDFEKFTSSNSVGPNYHISRNFHEKGNQFCNYTLQWEGGDFLINELSWVNPQNDTFHVVLKFLDRNNIFEVPYPALLETVEKLENPAILFDQGLTRAIVVNAALTPLLNQPVSELAEGFVIKDFFADELQFKNVMDWVMGTGSSVFSIEARLYLGSGESTWYELTLYKTIPEKDVLILCSLKDISVQKATEEKLTRTNELLSRVLEVQNHFLAQSEGANPYELLLGNILNVIDAKLGFVGKVNSDEEGKKVLKIHAATDFSHQGEAASRLYHKHIKDNFLFRHLDNLFGACIVESKIILENNPPSNPHTKGKSIAGHPSIDNFLGVPIFKGDEVIGLIGLGNKEGGFTEQDLSDLKPFVSTYSVIIEAFRSEQDKIRFEKESLVKARILAEVADHSPDLIVVMNGMNDFEFISPSASQFFDEGIRPEEIQRKISLLLKKTISPEFRLSEERYRSRLKLNIKKDGEYWVESNVNIIQEGSNQKVIAVIRDVSSQMDYEQRLIKSLKKEKQFNSFVSDFMNIVSHEFKTPLTTIISSMELSKYYLNNLPASPGVTKMKLHYEKMELELENLHKLMVHSLDYERFVNNSPALKKEKIYMVRFVENLLKAHGYLSDVDFASEIDVDFTVDWDKFLMETGIINLVGNALKYGGDLRKPVVKLFQSLDTYGIEVRDYGLGIVEEELPYVFTPFFRGSNVNGIEGTGFGLVAVKNFVEMHGGKVAVKSKINKGTTVVVSFPNAKKEGDN
ncbi:signal transduction histidine kinase [Algoriphagus sp. 4150]|uniref:ATP-binding protein n=1 Tax=Algoriphagus sp. 4150 TaxID=2817756 RepID=UPI00285D2131|nr:ATP-binding protein [Algoriphagus sp. 4150]MDR7132631.1 signal transduction histidine kinase [Algoriphagus sp. 4150]